MLAPVQPDYVYLGLAVPVTAHLLGYERQVSPSSAAVDPLPAEVFERRCVDESVELLVYRLPGALHVPLFPVFPVGSDEAEVKVEVYVSVDYDT